MSDINFDKSIFKRFFDADSAEVKAWVDNVVLKLTESRIIPAYIENSTDAQDFWRSITQIFGYIVIYSRKFESFPTNEELLYEFLTQKGLCVCKDQTLAELQYLLYHYYDEIRRRGTNQVSKNKLQSGKIIDGELLRLFYYNLNSEFIWGLIEEKNTGWNIGNSSPMYRGLTNHIEVIKGYEYSQDFVDLNKYPLIHKTQLELVQEGSKQILKIPHSTELEIGIGVKTDQSQVDFDKAIIVDPGFDYEITFLVKQIDLLDNFTFRVFAYNADNQQINLESVYDFHRTNTFFKQIKLNKNDIWYQIRGIIYNIDQTSIVDPILSIGYGHHLKFSSANICKIIPQIIVDNNPSGDSYSGSSISGPSLSDSDSFSYSWNEESSSSGSLSGALKIWDLKIRPLWTSYSRCFMNLNNLIIGFIKNNNLEKSEIQAEETIRNYLIPYNATFKIDYSDNINIIPPIASECYTIGCYTEGCYGHS